MKHKTLYAPLKAIWFKEIRDGEKDEEYRDNSIYWAKRICKYAKYNKNLTCDKCLLYKQTCFIRVPSYITHICLSYGYTKKRMTFKVNNIYIGYGRTEWGAPTGKRVFIIELIK